MPMYRFKRRKQGPKQLLVHLFIAELFIIAKRRNNPSVWQQISKMWISNMWNIHAMQCYLAIKGNEILIYATIWIYLKNIMLVK